MTKFLIASYELGSLIKQITNTEELQGSRILIEKEENGIIEGYIAKMNKLTLAIKRAI
jgi:hypothetical protein